ncbi:MAG: hypothetical protein MJZ34_13530 [Paludibacteraceae bacterium]|nr:hypothetical protein [Paludibacteraceae bacterium]
MDITTIFTTVLSCGISLAICLINNNVQTNKQKAENEKQIALIQYQIEELKREIEKSNNVKERVTKIEGMALLWDEKLKMLNARMKVVENDKNHDDGK